MASDRNVAVMEQYLEDCKLRKDPWILYECRVVGSSDKNWTAFTRHPSWNSDLEYRRISSSPVDPVPEFYRNRLEQYISDAKVSDSPWRFWAKKKASRGEWKGVTGGREIVANDEYDFCRYSGELDLSDELFVKRNPYASNRATLELNDGRTIVFNSVLSLGYVSRGVKEKIFRLTISPQVQTVDVRETDARDLDLCSKYFHNNLWYHIHNSYELFFAYKEDALLAYETVKQLFSNVLNKANFN